MDYCECGTKASGRCVSCAKPTCGAHEGRVHAAKAAMTDRLGLATRPAVLCVDCEARELADLRTSTQERVHAAIRAASPTLARLLALSSHLKAGGSKPGPETAHWPTFDALKEPAGLVEPNAYRELLALIRAGQVALRTGRMRVYVDGRVKHLTGMRTDSHVLEGVDAQVLQVHLTSSEWPVTVKVAVRADGSLLTAPMEVVADRYRVRISCGQALDPFHFSTYGDSTLFPIKPGEMRRRLAQLEAELQHIAQAAPGTNEFDAMVRERQPEVDPRFAEHQMFQTLWRSIDEERTPIPSL